MLARAYIFIRAHASDAPSNERGRVVVAVSMAAEPQAATADGSSLLRTVGPDDVFNLPLYEHHLVMDIRPSPGSARNL